MILLPNAAIKANGKTMIDAEQVNKQCQTGKWYKSSLTQLKENNFVLESKKEKEALALQLLNCLASADSEIRDGLAFETLSHWLRGGQLSNVVHGKMFEYLTNVLTSKVTDPNGVYQSFSMLMLSEVARVDRKKAFLSNEQREHLVNVGSDYFSNLKDYRGFSNKVGWRHGIAHSSDLMLQLALNPAITKTQLDKLLKALASQITANQQHAYIHGESKRMAMAVIYIFLRKEYSADDWQLWLTKATSASPLSDWQSAYKSEGGLIKLHNTQSFVYALYATIKPSKNEMLMSMIPALENAIKVVN